MSKLSRDTGKYGYRGAIARITRNLKKGKKASKYGIAKSLLYKKNKQPFSNTYGSSITIDRPIAGRGAFPNTLFTQLRYSDNLLLNADNLTGRTGSDISYRLNSLFDPYFAAGGHQPLGFDQLSAIYNNYTVYKVDVQVRVVQSSGSSGGKTFIAVNRRPSTSLYILGGLKTAYEIQEQPGNTVIAGDLLQTWNDTIWVADVEGKKRSSIFTENSFTGSASTNPTETPYISFTCGTFDEPASTSSWVRILVSFNYHCRFSNQNALPIS